MKEISVSPLSDMERTGPNYAIVTRYVRNQIAAGKWAPGSRLPAIKALAAELGTTYGTVYTALTPLVAEGLIQRVDGSGTYVRPSPATSPAVEPTKPGNEVKPSDLGTAAFVPPKEAISTARTGIYYSHDICRDGTFHGALREYLCQQLEQRETETQIWIDSRRSSEPKTLPRSLQEALQAHSVSSLICPMVTPATFKLLRDLPIPVTGLFSMPYRNWVTLHNNLFDVGVAELRQQGCTSIAVLSHVVDGSAQSSFAGESGTGAEVPLGNNFYLRFWKAAEKEGIPSGACAVYSPAEPVSGHNERFGYEQFKHLWNSRNRPDGLIIFSDATARGAVTAMIEMGIQVPRDLKVAIHCTAEADFVCPLEVTHLVYSAKALGEILLAQLDRQLKGDPAPPQYFPLVAQPT